MKSILDPTFHYTPSAGTDLRKTFARVRREMRRLERAAAAKGGKPPRQVFPLQGELRRA